MGVFVPVTPFTDFDLFGVATLTGVEQLFFIGGVAIAVGVYTYSRRVMETVGGSLLKLSPDAALIVVLAQAIVLFVFASKELETWLLSHGLPAFPLVPVSSSQAIIGGVIGIGLMKGARAIKFRVFGQIASGWVTTPVMACVITFFSLFFLQNVFNQQVSKKMVYLINEDLIAYSQQRGLYDPGLAELENRSFYNITRFKNVLEQNTTLNNDQIDSVASLARQERFYIDPDLLSTRVHPEMLGTDQLDVLRALSKKTFNYRWEFLNALADRSAAWRLKPDVPMNAEYNRVLEQRREQILEIFRIEDK
jgi:PiT family inorganic phosphate transporter